MVTRGGGPIQHMWPLEYVTLKTLDDIEEEEIDDPTYEGHHEALIDALLIGDNFVLAPHDNDEHVDFYLLKCTHEKVCLDSPLQDAWGNECPHGSSLIKGVLYQQKVGNPYNYKLLHSKPEACMLSHLVRAIKFSMESKGWNKYMMSHELYEALYNSIPFDM